MKNIILLAVITIMTSSFSSFAGEVETECPMMRDQRENMKQNMSQTKVIKSKKAKASAQ